MLCLWIYTFHWWVYPNYIAMDVCYKILAYERLGILVWLYNIIKDTHFYCLQCPGSKPRLGMCICTQAPCTCVCVSNFACMYICALPHACNAFRGQKDIRSPGIGVTHVCKLPCWSHGSSPAPLEEQPVFIAVNLLFCSLLKVFYILCKHPTTEQHLALSCFKTMPHYEVQLSC